MRIVKRALWPDSIPMLTEIYISALLVDEELADQVWELWNAGPISDDLAVMSWWLMASARSGQ